MGLIVDVIILSYTKNDDIFEMTKRCIESIIKSEENVSFNIHLIETEKSGKYSYDYDEVTTIIPNEEFNYNKFLNIGLKYCKNDWVLISNNDTEYEKGWLSSMMREYELDPNLLSMSPYCPKWPMHEKSFNSGRQVYYGYRTSYEMAGWSILMNRYVINTLGDFDEKFSFWYQDNDYAMNLKKHKIKHGLVRGSIVHHHVSKSHGLIEKTKKNNMTHGLSHIFNIKWG
jgi:GT2 family glycosyltransferase